MTHNKNCSQNLFLSSLFTALVIPVEHNSVHLTYLTAGTCFRTKPSLTLNSVLIYPQKGNFSAPEQLI